MEVFQQPWQQRVKEVQIRKTRKGWIGNELRQVHLRRDISCGFVNCAQHVINNVFDHTSLSKDTIYILDSYTLIHQTDIIYNCSQLKNIIILQSSIQKLKYYTPTVSENITRKHNRNISKYNAFKSFLQAISASNQRAFYIIPDHYHKDIRSNLQEKLNQIDRLTKCVQWYTKHMSQMGMSQLKFVILTANSKQYKNINKIQVVDLISFLKINNSNLLDFVGFVGTYHPKQANYTEHIPYSQAEKQIKMGRLIQGKFMAERSYIKIGSKMIKVKLRNNRAVFGDQVAIQLDNVVNWGQSKSSTLSLDVQQQLFQVDQSSTIQNQNSNILQLINSKPHLIPSGKIVSIIKSENKNFCGSIVGEPVFKSSSLQMKQQNEPQYQVYEFLPADQKYGKFYIRTYKSAQLKNKRIIVAIDNWPATSKYPLAHYIRTIGDVGDATAEADTILLEHNVQIREFSKAAYACLPEKGQEWSIPNQQIAQRLDLRGINVVSIDPPGCKDIDDALHCIQLPNGNLQVGVHIADVSYYVRPDSALDMQARNRCTTVYLVDRRTDMLPKLLTQNLCSLKSNVDRLAFSVIWQIDHNANIINAKYTKSAIRSRRAFTYMQAQNLMQSDDQGEIAKAVRRLNSLAKKFKQRRNQQGALTLASTQVKITLQEQTHSATDVQLYQLVEANYLIQEFMLLANIAVAEKIYQRFPALSILRKHAPPKQSELRVLKQVLQKLGFQLKWNSSLELAACLDKANRINDPFFNKLIRIMTTRCMNQATYFCSADHDKQQFYHYGLAAPFYTHFTSPIRRYADVLVHRLLSAAIDLQPLPSFMINKLKMAKVCDQMNMRNRMARYASRASSDYHTYQFFRGRDSPQEGVITSIQTDTVVVMLTKYGLQTKIKLKQQEQIQTVKLNEGAGLMTKVNIGGKIYSLFDYVKVLVKVQLKGFHKVIEIKII